MKSQTAAATLSQLQLQIDALQRELAKPAAKTDSTSLQERKIDANRAADEVEILKQTLHHWYAFYDNYDPLFTWWNSESYHRVNAALDAYSHFLREKIAGVRPVGATTRKPSEDDERFNAHAVKWRDRGRYQRHHRQPDRPGTFARGTCVRNDSIHAGRIDRCRQSGICLV